MSYQQVQSPYPENTLQLAEERLGSGKGDRVKKRMVSAARFVGQQMPMNKRRRGFSKQVNRLQDLPVAEGHGADSCCGQPPMFFVRVRENETSGRPTHGIGHGNKLFAPGLYQRIG
jgi:hypothetical protein